MAPTPRKRARVVYIIFILAIAILFLSFTREASTRVDHALSSAPGGKQMSRLVRQVTHTIKDTVFGDDDDGDGGGGGGAGAVAYMDQPYWLSSVGVFVHTPARVVTSGWCRTIINRCFECKRTG
jgi:hypothetical protein